MAVWQFDLLFVPKGAAAPQRDGRAWVLPLVPECRVVHAHAYLSEAFGSPWQMCEGILVFGAENGNRLEVVLDDHGDAELSARIDARNESAEFCNYLCELASVLDCHLFSPELGATVDGGPELLIAALMRSQAWEYALDPTSANRRHPDGSS